MITERLSIMKPGSTMSGRTIKRLAKLRPRPMQYYAILTVVYLALILLLPANSQALQSYQLSAIEYKILHFAIAVPVILVWFAAFYGYAKLEEYARSLKGTEEADAFWRLAVGCRWLAWSLPLTSLIALTLNSVADTWGGLQAASTILINYTTLILSLIAFTAIGRASRALVTQARIRFSAAAARSLMLIFVGGGVLYCYLTFHRLEPGSLSAANNPYHLPVWLLLITIIIPYLYAWFVGLLAVYEITSYSKQVRGVLYKQSLHLLIAGLVTVIAGFIAMQYISSALPSPGYLALDYRLVLLTIFRVTSGVGFALIAIGALRLKKIEEV